MSQMEEATSLINHSKLFAQKCYAQSYNAVTAVFGHSKAGKSVFIDVLAGRKVVMIENIDLGTKNVVEENNHEAQYPSLYISQAKPSTVLLECFNLDQEVQAPSEEVLKLVLLKQFLEQTTKAAFIVLVEELYKEDILIYLERFLQCLGITSNEKEANLDTIKNYVYLMLTKTEQGQLEYFKEILSDLASGSQNQNVQEIINYLLGNDRIEEFKIQDPDNDFAEKVRTQFAANPFNKQQMMAIINNSNLNLPSEPFSQDQQAKILEFFQQNLKLVGALILFANSEERTHQREYEGLAKKLYSDQKSKNETQTMLGKWSKAALPKLNLPASISAIKAKQVTLQTLTGVVTALLKTMQQYSQAKRDYDDIIGRVVFVRAIQPWLNATVLLSKVADTASSLAIALEKASESTSKSPISAKPSIRAAVKKGNTPFNNFREAVLKQCRSNRSAIEFCLSAIKNKEKQESFDHYQLIYHIKLLKDLLEEFDFKAPSEHHLFIKELMELALYTENYFDFANYLTAVIRSKALTFNQAHQWMKNLYKCGKYDFCEKLVDYIIADCVDEANFERFVQFKANLKGKINQQYLERDGPQVRPERKPLSFTAADLLSRKGRGGEFEAYLGSISYEKHLITKQ